MQTLAGTWSRQVSIIIVVVLEFIAAVPLLEVGPPELVLVHATSSVVLDCPGRGIYASY